MPLPAIDEQTWTLTIGPGHTLYAVGYKAGLDDVTFNFENDNSYADLPILVLWGRNAVNINQAKGDILGYPMLANGVSAGQYVSRVTPMTILPFTSLTTGRPFLFATAFSGTGYGVPTDGNPSVVDLAMQFPSYHMAKGKVHFESLSFDIYTDQQMIYLGLTDANGNPDEATLARYVTREFSPGTEYLSLPQGGFSFVTQNNPPVPGTAGKLSPNYDIALTWELVPLSCVGSVLFNPNLENPPIDNCLGCSNDTPFPAQPGATQQTLSGAVIASGGTGYRVGDFIFLVGGLAGQVAILQVTTVGAAGVVTGLGIITGGNYVNNGAIPSPPTNPVSTVTNGDGTGLTITATFIGILQQQLMTAYPAESGTGYALGDVLNLVGGTSSITAQVRVVALNTNAATGPVLAVDIVNRGRYAVNPGTPSPPVNPVSTLAVTGAGAGLTLSCEFGNGIPPGQALMTAATIQPIRSPVGDRLYRLMYRFKFLPQGVQRLYYQGSPAYSNGPTVNINNVTNVIGPTITTAVAHGFHIGEVVNISGVTGATGVNGIRSVITVPTPTTFTVNTPAPGAYVGGGTVGLSGAYQDAGYYEVTTNGFTNTGFDLYNNNSKTPPVNIYPWADFNTLFRVPS